MAIEEILMCKTSDGTQYLNRKDAEDHENSFEYYDELVNTLYVHSELTKYGAEEVARVVSKYFKVERR